MTKSERVLWIELTWDSRCFIRLLDARINSDSVVDNRQIGKPMHEMDGKTHSSPAGASRLLVPFRGFSMTQSSPVTRQRLQGGSSAPTHLIFIRRQ